ncbi:hypothetical protein [Bifidobacterium xylocopae]|nr:hypothetical protein [Bifidobacterium xylocopae]
MALVAITAGRLVMSLTLHMWYPFTQRADDALLMSYSFPEYPNSSDRYKLAKNQGYGWFLRAVGWSRINIDTVYFLLWFLAAVLVAFATYRFFHRTWLALSTYIYVLWNPLAFENWQGTRVYRNSIFAPTLFILLALLMLFLTSTPPKSKCVHGSTPGLTAAQILAWLGMGCFYCVLGLVFTIIYDMKEDSIWLVPMFIFVLSLKVITVVRSHSDIIRKTLAASLCLLPLISAYSGLEAIKSYNARNFGVHMLNTRTTGEIAGFISRIYKIKSLHQTPEIWSPADSIVAAEKASPTLQTQPGIIDYVTHSDFAAPDILVKPLTGDYISWQMLAAIDETIGMEDENAVQQFFRKVNMEIDAAFSDGSLTKTDKISVSSSLVPRSKHEIIELFDPASDVFSDTFTLQRYYQVSHNVNIPATGKYNIVNKRGLQQLNIDPRNPNPRIFPLFSYHNAQEVASTVVTIYMIVNILLLIVLLINLFCCVRDLHHRKWIRPAFTALSLCLFLYAYAYAFFAMWYAQYLKNTYVQFFYTAGLLTPFVAIGLILGLGAFCSDGHYWESLFARLKEYQANRLSPPQEAVSLHDQRSQ